jgi:hypothetical protein
MTSASWTFSATRTAPLPASVIGGRALAQTHHIDAVAEHVEGAALVELGADAIQEGSLGGRTLLLHQSLPGLRLGFLDPGEKVRREQGAGAVVEGSARWAQISDSRAISWWRLMRFLPSIQT